MNKRNANTVYLVNVTAGAYYAGLYASGSTNCIHLLRGNRLMIVPDVLIMEEDQDLFLMWSENHELLLAGEDSCVIQNLTNEQADNLFKSHIR